jgi:hypothetical protein
MTNKNKKTQSANPWKWGQSSTNAMQVVGQFFGLGNPQSIKDVKDSEVQKALKNADESTIQVKRVQDYTMATKRQWKNQTRIGAMIHGLVRNGMQMIKQQRIQESQTTKEYAKLITDTSVLSAKTNTAIEKTYARGEKQIQQTGKQLQLTKEELDEQYQVTDTTAVQQSQQRRLSYRDRAQKRLAANNRPWRNY